MLFVFKILKNEVDDDGNDNDNNGHTKIRNYDRYLVVIAPFLPICLDGLLLVLFCVFKICLRTFSYGDVVCLPASLPD